MAIKLSRMSRKLFVLLSWTEYQILYLVASSTMAIMYLWPFGSISTLVGPTASANILTLGAVALTFVCLGTASLLRFATMQDWHVFTLSSSDDILRFSTLLSNPFIIALFL